MIGVFSLFIITNENGTPILAKIGKCYYIDKSSNSLTDWWRRFVSKLFGNVEFWWIETEMLWQWLVKVLKRIEIESIGQGDNCSQNL